MSPSHDREEPPEWGNDPLSGFFRDAEYNARVTAVKLPAVYELLQRVHTLSRKFEDLIAKDSREEFVIPRFLMVRTHSSCLAGLRLAISGQVSEAFAVLATEIAIRRGVGKVLLDVRHGDGPPAARNSPSVVS